jgi:hypothetical protein
MSQHKTIGARFDAIVLDMRRLLLAHCIAAAIASTAIWIHLGPEYASPTYHRAGGTVVLVTLAAWVPYVLSWALARKVLPGRGVAIGFIICLATACIFSSAAYLGLFAFSPHTLGISVVTTVALAIANLSCAAFGRSLASSNNSLERTRER